MIDSEADIFAEFMKDLSVTSSTSEQSSRAKFGESFTQSEIDKMDYDRSSNSLQTKFRSRQKITDETKRSQFAGPRRNRAQVKRNYCDDCDQEMEKDQFDSGLTGYLCGKCGKQGEYCYESVVDSTDLVSTGNDSSTYNTSVQSSVPLNIVGPGGRTQRRGIISDNASYKKTQERTTRTQIQTTLSNSKSGERIPEDIRREAANLFLRIQDKKIILRGDRRKGTMAACLDRKCRQNGLPRKCVEIANMFGIDQETLSVGHRLLDMYIEKGIIDSEGTSGEYKDYDGEIEIVGYINRYFESLGIPLDDGYGNYGDMQEHFMEEQAAGGAASVEAFSGELGHPNYKEFALQLIKFTRHFKIANTSMDSSKCAGVIYIIAMRFPDLKVGVENIETECAISKTTFTKFAKEVDKVLHTQYQHAQLTKRKLRHLFKKYNIPLK